MSTKTAGVRIGGFRLTFGADERRIEQIRRSIPYRYLVRPVISSLRRRKVAPDDRKNGALKPNPTFDPSRLTGDAAKIWGEVSALRWYHCIDLGHGIVTPGTVDRRAVVDRYALPEDLHGKRALDVGTYDGYWAFEMESRGAEVVATDLDSPEDYDLPRNQRPSPDDLEEIMEKAKAQVPGTGFRLAKKILGSKVERKCLNVYKISPEEVGTFDIAFISEVLLHLRDPQTALENIFSVLKPGGMLIVCEPYQLQLEEYERPISEFKGAVYWGIWWSFSTAAIRRMLEVAGFNPIEEVSRMRLTNVAGQFDKIVLKAHVPADMTQAAENSTTGVA